MIHSTASSCTRHKSEDRQHKNIHSFIQSRIRIKNTIHDNDDDHTTIDNRQWTQKKGFVSFHYRSCVLEYGYGLCPGCGMAAVNEWMNEFCLRLITTQEEIKKIIRMRDEMRWCCGSSERRGAQHRFLCRERKIRHRRHNIRRTIQLVVFRQTEQE